MADEFFTKKVCDRCGKPLTVRTMSMLSGIPDNIDYQESSIIRNFIVDRINSSLQ